MGKSRTFASFISIGIVIFFFLKQKEFAYSIEVILPSILALFLPVFIGIRFVQTKSREHFFFFPVLLLSWLYFLEGYLGPTKIIHYNRVIPEEFLPEMALFPFLGMISMAIGYYTSFRKKTVKPISNISFKFSNSELSFLIILLIILRLFQISFPIIFQLLGRITQFFDFIPTIVLGVLTIYWIRKGKNIFLYLVSSLYILTEYLYFVAQTLFTYVLLIFFGGWVIYILEKKKIPVLILLVFLLVNIPVYFTRYEFRKDVAVNRWYNPDAHYTRIDIIEEGYSNLVYLWNNWSYSHLLKNEASYNVSPSSYRNVHKNRMEQISYFGHCVYNHELLDKPYKTGESFWWLPLTPIPRIIFPVKPVNEMATKVAEDYGLKGRFTKGAMNFPLMVEFYINFGFWGIPLMSFFHGIFLRFILEKLKMGLGDLNLLILLNLFIFLIRIGANITLVFGAIIQIFLFWVVGIFLLKQIFPKSNI